MDLRTAYVVLELEPGSSEEAVRDARKLLMKVWHPDRHANDPELEKRAQTKVSEVNVAFEAIRAAGFPSAIPPKAAEPAKFVEPPRPPTPVPPQQSKIEIVPRRRIRWSVIVLLVAAIGAGTYFAVVKLGASDPPASRGGGSAVVVAPADHPPSTAKTFGLGATHEDVLAAQGTPTSQTTVVDEQWMYGFSIVTFNKRGVVAGWWDRDDVLNVKLVPSDPSVAASAKAAGSYAMGASKDEVIGVQGTPNHIETVVDEQWFYGTGSSLTFNGTGHVTGYHNVNGELALR